MPNIKKIKDIESIILNQIEQRKVQADKLRETEEAVLQHCEEIENLSNQGVLTFKERKEASEVAGNLKNMLRKVSFTPENELKSEKALSSFTKTVMKNHSKENPDAEWEVYYLKLIDHMKEHRNCYFTETKNPKDLGYWVAQQRKYLQSPHGDRYKKEKLLQIKIRDEESNCIKHGRDPLIGSALDEARDYNLDQIDKNTLDHFHYQRPDDCDQNINHTTFLWSNQEAHWMMYYKELKKYYKQHGHCLVQASYAPEKTSNLHLGTWVLRMRQEFKKKIFGPGLEYSPGYINKYKLLYNIFFTFQTDLNKIFDIKTGADDVIDLLDLTRRFGKRKFADNSDLNVFSLSEIEAQKNKPKVRGKK